MHSLRIYIFSRKIFQFTYCESQTFSFQISVKQLRKAAQDRRVGQSIEERHFESLIDVLDNVLDSNNAKHIILPAEGSGWNWISLIFQIWSRDFFLNPKKVFEVIIASNAEVLLLDELYLKFIDRSLQSISSYLSRQQNLDETKKNQ